MEIEKIEKSDDKIKGQNIFVTTKDIYSLSIKTNYRKKWHTYIL